MFKIGEVLNWNGIIVAVDSTCPNSQSLYGVRLYNNDKILWTYVREEDLKRVLTPNDVIKEMINENNDNGCI